MPEYRPARWPHVVGTYDEREVDPETGVPEPQKYSIKCERCGAAFGPSMCNSGMVRTHVKNFALSHRHEPKLMPTTPRGRQ